MDMWKDGRLSELLHEEKGIQKWIIRKEESKSARDEQRFIRLMDAREIPAALQCIVSLQCGVHETTAVIKTLQ